MTINTDSVRFQRDVIQSELPVIVDFWAPWCGPCLAIGPVLEKMAETYQDHIRLVKVNVDENPQLAAQYRIQGIPTMIAFLDGEPVDQIVGMAAKSRIKQFFENLQVKTSASSK